MIIVCFICLVRQICIEDINCVCLLIVVLLICADFHIYLRCFILLRYCLHICNSK